MSNVADAPDSVALIDAVAAALEAVGALLRARRKHSRGGPRRRMLALAAEHEGERIEEGKWGPPVCEGDTPVGTSRRQGFRYTLRRGIAAVLIDLTKTRAGDAVVIPHPAAKAVCRLVEFPLVPARSS